MSEVTIFERMIAGEVPCDKVYEDEHTLAFNDINPQAPVHVLVIPKKKLVNVASSQDEDALILGQLLVSAKKVAEKLGVTESGYRLVLNNNANGGQSVDYLHCHVLGGRKMSWPPG